MLTSMRNMVVVAVFGVLVAPLGCKQTNGLGGSSGIPALAAQNTTDPVKTTPTGDPNAGNYTIDFGNVAVGLDQPTKVVLSNTGTSPLQILNVTAPTDAEFSVSLTPGTQVLSGSNFDVAVDFKPFSKGPKTATVVIGTDSTTIPTVTLTMTGTGVDLKLGVDPQLLDFGTVVVHTSITKSINLTNASDLDLTLTPSALTGPAAQFFTLSQTTPFVLPANSSAPIQATFAPATPSGGAEDTANFTLSLSTGAPVVITLQGIAVATGLSVTPNPLDFNFVQPGQQLTKALHIQNLGGQPVSISSIAVTDPGAGQVFALANGQATMLTVAAGQTVDVNVTFSPTGSQQYTGELQIASNDNLPLQAIPLMGYGGGAAITCTPLRLDFGTVAANFTVTLPVICTNTGTDVMLSGKPDPSAELKISGFKFSNGATAFSAIIDSSSPQGPLLANQSVLIDVSYAPTATEMDSATMTIQSNVINPPAPPVATLTGQAILEDKCYYSLTPTQLNWGQVKPLMGTETAYTQAFIITNTGPNECLVNAVGLVPGSDTAFSMNQIVSQRLSPPGLAGAQFPTQLVVPVSFFPTATGNYSGTVGFTISDPDGPNVRVPLSGTGGDSCFIVKPVDLNFGVVGLSNGAYCAKGKKQFVGVNGCQSPVTITAVTLATGSDTSPFAFITSVVPQTVAAGQTSQPFVVGFKPTAAGSYYSSAQVQTDLQQTSFGVFFNGTAANGSTQTDHFTGQTPTADILWVMDTDDDEGERTEVAKYGADFVTALEADGIDFQISVTSSDTCPGSSSDNGRILPCDGCNLSGSNPPPIITQDDPSAGSDLSTLLAITGGKNHGNCGDEKFYETSYQGLVSGIGATANNNLGFIRPGAYLAVITANMDNEDDNSPSTVDYYANEFFTIKGADHPELFSWSYINPSEFGSPGGHQPFNRLPQRIASMLSLVGGVALDTTQPEWYKGILDLWQIVLASNKQFALSGTPDPSTIQIYLDGPPPDQANGDPPGALIQATNPNGSWNWRYDATSNTIQVNPATLSLQATDVLYAEYTLVCN